MSWLIDFFKSLGQLITSGIQFLIDGVKSIIMLITMIPEYVGYVANMISILPAWLIVFLGGLTAITIIWTIRRAI